MTSLVPESPLLGSFEVVGFLKGHPANPIKGLIQCPHGERYLFKVSADGNTCDYPLDGRADCGCRDGDVRYEAACAALDHKDRIDRYVMVGSNGWIPCERGLPN